MGDLNARTDRRERELDSRITLAVLRQLTELEDQGSLGGVARQMGLSQPTVSANLSRLETTLGFPLLLRGARGTQLTRDGVRVSAAARSLLRAAREFAGTIVELPMEESSPLRIAASLTIAEQLVPRWLADRNLARVIAPGQVELSVGNSEEVMEWVSSQRSDLGFVEGNRIRPGLAHLTVGRDELVVVVGPSHHWSTENRVILPDELVRAGLVVREPGSGTREVLVDALALVGLTLPHRLPSFGSTSAILTAVRHGGAVAVVSRLAADTDLAEGKLTSIDIPSLSLTRILTAVWNPHQTPRRDASDLVANLAREAR